MEQEDKKDSANEGFAKVYVLLSDGSWSDRGKGKVSVRSAVSTSDPSPPSSSGAGGLFRICVAITSQEGKVSDIPFQITVSENDSLSRNDTIISFESGDGQEVAISFQESSECDLVWSLIGSYQAGGVDQEESASSSDNLIGPFEPQKNPEKEIPEEGSASKQVMMSEGSKNFSSASSRSHRHRTQKKRALGNTSASESSSSSSSIDPTLSSSLAAYSQAMFGDFSFVEGVNAASMSSGGSTTSSSFDSDSDDEGTAASFDEEDFDESSGGYMEFGLLSAEGQHSTDGDGSALTRAGKRRRSRSRPEGSQSSIHNDTKDSKSKSLFLPSPDLTSIVAIRDRLQQLLMSDSTISKNRLLSFLCKKRTQYITDLYTVVFKEAEDLNDPQVSAAFSAISHMLLQLNDSALTDVLVSDGVFESLVGSLDFDPFPSTDEVVVRRRNKEYFQSKVRFRLVVPITDSDLLSLIHKHSRIDFLREVVLSKNYIESVLSALRATQFFTADEICHKVISSPTILPSIAAILASNTSSYDALTSARSRSTSSASSSSTTTMTTATIEKPRDVKPASVVAEGLVIQQPSKLRKDALFFLRELLRLGGQRDNAQYKPTFFRSLNEKLAPVYSLFEPVLGDRHADKEELVSAFELLHTFAAVDIHSFREYVLTQRRHPPAPLKRSNKSKAGLPNPPLTPLSTSASAKKPESVIAETTSPYFCSSGTAASVVSPGALTIPPTTATASNVPIDDNVSIRLYEKLESLKDSFSTYKDVPTADFFMDFNLVRRAAGEHGRLVEGVSPNSTLLMKLVWRIVDDPDIEVQALANDTLRMLLEVETHPGIPVENSAVFDIFLSHYISWLVTPFTNSDLPEPINYAASTGMAMLKSILTHSATPRILASTSDSRPSAVVSKELSALACSLASGFDGSIGGESMSSKHSKGLVGGLVSFALSVQTNRMKIITNRLSLHHHLLRLLRYKEKVLVVQGVQILKQMVQFKDFFISSEIVSKNLLSSAAAAFVLNNKRPNLLQSAFLDLFFVLAVSADNKQIQRYVTSTFAPLVQWSGLLSLVEDTQTDKQNSLSISSQLSSEGRNPSNNTAFRLNGDSSGGFGNDAKPPPQPFKSDWDEGDSYFFDLDSLGDGDDDNQSNGHSNQEQVTDEDPADVVSRIVSAGGRSDGNSSRRLSEEERDYPTFIPPPLPQRTSSALPLSSSSALSASSWKSDVNESAFFSRSSSLQARGSTDVRPSTSSASIRHMGGLKKLKGLIDDYNDEFEFDEEDDLGSGKPSSSNSPIFASSEEAHEKELSSENGKSDEVNMLLGTRRPSSSIARAPQLAIPSVFSIRVTSSALSSAAEAVPKMAADVQESEVQSHDSETSGWSVVDDSSSSAKSEENPLPKHLSGWDNPV